MENEQERDEDGAQCDGRKEKKMTNIVSTCITHLCVLVYQMHYGLPSTTTNINHDQQKEAEATKHSIIIYQIKQIFV